MNRKLIIPVVLAGLAFTACEQEEAKHEVRPGVVEGGGADLDIDLGDLNGQEGPELMSMSEFSRIHNGMSVSQVQQIVGSTGELTVDQEIAGITGQIYSWEGVGDLGANAMVQFQDGKVISKSQFGLEG